MPVKHALKSRLCVLRDQEAFVSSLSALTRLKEKMTSPTSENPV
ncbi:hypothetical protein MM2B1231_1042 [Mycobacteroides abscessus subsp. bolletii 2B-1231]|uniref:Uncharacterized protein n=1 Tax=Mycobacteroides abscessus MAB_091912_2446 TaxID=1335414 RepID=A0A829MEN3_9MYCO|nr:hypothetical protein MM2B0626_0981 [Mycobacteroides abscessus subsp. bolletii 2B-0626]EIV14618.1 hypothetical protein MM2B0912R_1382 [Mycobacteroides abscessus subsp. bolletii 2B-0912-R]EIV15557.1 hypothetical protein MM2B0307_0314 [Mycobacteroides abscessus subsp. bolletii 2B-0307]EIV27289.1 hypothetical protein MM2B0912S_0982 [Mycobacteroides abscessus subsp. bolletii 2B-0912-S]EIV80285.1 hypothetical protein MM2B1231_1042 [Mycobacteroides abscessus subsp. bolletii 2B-1231]EIV80925.1 hypo